MAAAGPTSGVCAVLLAAGASRRFGDANKLLEELDGAPLVRRVAEQLMKSRARGPVVVTGHEAEKMRAALDGLDATFADNPEHAEGLASSLRRGIAAVPEEAQGAMIVLGDMPGLTAALADRLIATFEEAGGGKIVYPSGGDGAQRNPVIWPRRFFAELKALTGDKGAKGLIAAHEQDTLAVPVGEEEAFHDIDTPEDLAAWGGERG